MREPRERADDLVSVDQMKAAFRTLASGVVVVTCWVDNRAWGLTVNSCCSLSIEPSRVLLSLQRHTRSRYAIETNGAFGLCILGERQQEVARLAALPGTPKFIDEYCDAHSGMRVPIVRNSLWHLECVLYRTIDLDDHVVIVGDVSSAVQPDQTRARDQPLLYFDGAYRLLGGHP